ncbi:uncharacterized protein K444DRAFT_720792, partial [Hyaloscypha bicolor E]
LPAPASDIVEYEDRIFTTGFHGDRTVYQGRPNPENLASWTRLTTAGIVKLDEQEAKRLPNKTAQVSGEPGSYIASLEMFHQLHCLNQLRLVYFDETKDMSTDDKIKVGLHIDHCVDYLRQAIMCHGDIEMITFDWDENKEYYPPNYNVVHRCRKFEPIERWALDRQVQDLIPG